MGSDLMRRPPRYVHGYLDRHGRPRFYFRKHGVPSAVLPGLPWSPEFMAAYAAAMAGQPAPVERPDIKVGSIRALAVSYFASTAFQTMASSSQRVRRKILERFCQEHGDKSAVALRREHVVKLMAARAAKPESANGVRKALRALMQHAIEIGLRPDDPTQGVKAIRTKSGGFHSWSDDEITQFETTHAIGTRSRLAFALLLYTGQRRSDVVHMGRQHVRDGILYLRQLKTGTELAVPVHPELRAIIDKSVGGQMTFLVTELRQPFTAAGFGNWFRAQCNKAGLPHCSAHGLRKAAARRLAEAGCTVHEIAAITGHASLGEVTRYTKAADQKRLAQAAMNKVKQRTS